MLDHFSTMHNEFYDDSFLVCFLTTHYAERTGRTETNDRLIRPTYATFDTSVFRCTHPTVAS